MGTQNVFYDSRSCRGQKYQKWRKKNEISSLKGKRDTQMKNNLKSEKKKRIDDSL